MKKLPLGVMGALLAAGIIFAASFQPSGNNINTNTGNNTLSFCCWEGIGTGHWATFEIYYSDLNDDMWGTWQNGDYGGFISGKKCAEVDPPVEGTFVGCGAFTNTSFDTLGTWSGIFILCDTCFGDIYPYVHPPDNGHFWGHDRE